MWDKVLELQFDEVEVSVSNGQWLRRLRETMTHPDLSKNLSTVPSFHAKLREYQEKGYYWLNRMSQFGLGACFSRRYGFR